MKAINFILFGFVLLFASCSGDDPTEFAGTYSGEVRCFSDEDGSLAQETTIVISENSDGTFNFNIDGDSDFNATADGNVLTIDRQMPIGSDFEPYLEGTLTENEDGSFFLVVTVDEDGDVSNCSATLTR